VVPLTMPTTCPNAGSHSAARTTASRAGTTRVAPNVDTFAVAHIELRMIDYVEKFVTS
jgi:hypothetical protein